MRLWPLKNPFPNDLLIPVQFHYRTDKFQIPRKKNRNLKDRLSIAVFLVEKLIEFVKTK